MSKKTISVNPMYLNPKSNSKQKKQTRKTSGYEKKQTNKLRTKLLSKIKNHRQQQQQQQQQQQKQQNIVMQKTSLEDTSEFDKSLSYLQGIVKNKTNKRHAHKHHVKDLHQPASVLGNPPSSISHTSMEVNTSSDTNNNTQPPYSCLKNGSRPTYRTWKNRQHKPKLTINSGVMPTPTENSRSKQLRELKAKQSHKPTFNEISPTPLLALPAPSAALQIAPPPPPPPPLSPPPISLQPFNHMQKNASIATPIPISNAPISNAPISNNKMAKTTKKYTKFKLGKDGKRVGVLIKDRYTRKKIKEGHRQLKRKSIVEVKNYLKEHQLLKVGSPAPNDVLRATYEQAILAGEVNNKADDALMHNYLAKN